MRLSSVLIGLIFLLSPPAWAEEIPRYDVEAYCEEVAGLGSSYSEFLEGACFDQEQRAYDLLKLDWAQIPQRMRSHCDDVATLGGDGSYFMLEACIDQEKRSASTNSKRKFKY